MTQQPFSPDAYDATPLVSEPAQQFDRSELFALGAAAGAIAVAALSQYLGRSKTPSEQTQEQDKSNGALETIKDSTTSGGKPARGAIDRVSEQVKATFGSTDAKDTKESAKEEKKEGGGLLGGLLGSAAVSKVTTTAKETAAKALSSEPSDDPYAVSGSVEETRKAKQEKSKARQEKSDETESSSGGLLSTIKGAVGLGVATKAASSLADKAKETAANVVSSTAQNTDTPQRDEEESQDKSSGLLSTIKGAIGLGVATKAASSLAGKAKETATKALGSTSDATVSDSVEETRKAADGAAQGLGSWFSSLFSSASDATKGAQSSLKDAQLGEKAKQYGNVAAEKTKGLATTAQESLKQAQLDKRLKEAGGTLAGYTNEAAKATSKVAKQGATTLSTGASQLAETTSDVASNVGKGVKRTGRRTKWGIRAFIFGLVAGLLAAPRSGQSTREVVSTFMEDLLDVFVSSDEKSPLQQ